MRDIAPSIRQRLFGEIPRRGWIGLAVLGIGLLLTPWIEPDFVPLMVLIFYFAYVGQAWNIMMGFAGQLSLGHSLYVGLGAYAAAIFYIKTGIGPWAGLFLAIALATAVGGLIGYLGFRFAITGVYFALLTIAFAEFCRILFDHLQFFGGSGGLYLKVENRQENDLFNLRGSPTMFYYVMLSLVALALALCRWLLSGRLGHYWLAIREDPEAAQAIGINVFRYKMYAVLLSSGMTALGGVFIAFYYNNLYPEQTFSMGRSIELLLGPIIGGIGTLFGPILGSALLVLVGEGMTDVTEAWQLPGLKQILYGMAVLLIVLFLPGGVWPWIARHLGLVKTGDGK
ncbi:MAG: branched-chain amino acid ABC transporter permease [Rhodospirillales bacterium]